MVRSISVQSPFDSRLTSVFIKRSSVKRTVHGSFFLAHTILVKECYDKKFTCFLNDLGNSRPSNAKEMSDSPILTRCC